MSGSLITLFNRVNSQTVRTKYMCVENRQLCAKNTTWSAFQILLAHPRPDEGGRPAPPQPITYGSHVVLRCMETNVYSGVLVIQRVVNGLPLPNPTAAVGAASAAAGSTGGAVSQMQKIALAFASRDDLYLSLAPATETGAGSQFLRYQPLAAAAGKGDVDAHLTWTIVGVERTVYRYAELARPFAHRLVPLALVLEASLEKNVLELRGRSFAPDTVVCVGSQPVTTRVVGQDRMVCVLPPPLADHDFDRLTAHLGYGRHMYAAVLLTRPDGIVSHSGHFVVSERPNGGPVTLRVIGSI
jgi:hypothetical protein